MSTVFQEEIELVTMVCGKCGITFAVPSTFKNEHKETGGEFYCPNGHCRVYGETDVKRLTRELATAHRQRVEALNREYAERQLRIDAQTKLKKYQRRVTNGTCPCCQRSFVNLVRHMKSKHPDQVIPATKPIN